MSTTVSNVAIGGTLAVTGAATLSSTLGVTGAATLSSTLAVTGAATLSSTLGVTGVATLTGGMYGVLASSSAINDNATTYTWAQLDGTNPLTVPSIRMYDHGTNVYRVCYLLNGTLTVI